MALSLEEVEHIAELARLKLTDEEKALYRGQLSAVLEYAVRLQSIDTSAIPPTSSVLPRRSVLREDCVRSGLTQEQLFANAPKVDDDQFKVPPIFE